MLRRLTGNPRKGLGLRGRGLSPGVSDRAVQFGPDVVGVVPVKLPLVFITPLPVKIPLPVNKPLPVRIPPVTVLPVVVLLVCPAVVGSGRAPGGCDWPVAGPGLM